MNRSLVLAIAVLAVIALTVWFFATPRLPIKDTTNTNSTSSTTTTAQTKAAASPKAAATKAASNSNTYKSLLTQSGSYECDYEQVQSSGQNKNVIYLYDGKMRGEFRTLSSGASTANLFVYDGHYLYQWQEGTSVGTRTVLSSLSQLPLVIPKDLTSGKIVGSSYESVGWNCHTWLTNKSLLSPPSYVTFN